MAKDQVEQYQELAEILVVTLIRVEEDQEVLLVLQVREAFQDPIQVQEVLAVVTAAVAEV
jgi:hypothetical protein